MNPLAAKFLKGALGLGGLALAGTAADYGAKKLFGNLGESPEDRRAEKDRDFQRQLELSRQEHQYALEQIKAQTGATDAQASALLQEMEADRLLRQVIAERSLDPALYAQRASIDQANWERRQELSRLAGAEQTRELTRRKIESDTIAAWQGITEAQLKADALLAQGMMNLAYTAGMPNPNVLQAGANFAQQGAAGFDTPRSTIS
jgi:hypothetical protein